MALRLGSYRMTMLKLLATLYVMLMLYGFLNTSSRVVITMPLSVDTQIRHTVLFNRTRCTYDLNKLGVVDIDISTPDMKQIEAENSVVNIGGVWAPKDCIPGQKLAIIVPYRDRGEHLQHLLRRLHPMLRQQRVSYRIIVVEQEGSDKFNRGRLKNIGVVEAIKIDKFDCFVFHDVDLLPENNKNIYYCDEHIRQLSSAIDEMRYHMMYNNNAGGVVALNLPNLLLVNGYSNDYWGWGNEDDDLSARSMAAGLHISRPPDHIGRFKMLRHTKQWRAHNAYEMFLTWRDRWQKDGLNSLDGKYRVSAVKAYPLHTHILANVGPAPDHPPDLTGVKRESLSWFIKFFFA